MTTPLITTPSAGGENRITSGMSVYPVGSGAPLHSHNCDEHVTVLEGDAEVWVDGEVTKLERFDTTYVPSPSPTCSATWETRRCASCGCTPRAT
ncbi:cupin domain-containing protein [Streptomyces tendae]